MHGQERNTEIEELVDSHMLREIIQRIDDSHGSGTTWQIIQILSRLSPGEIRQLTRDLSTCSDAPRPLSLVGPHPRRARRD